MYYIFNSKVKIIVCFLIFLFLAVFSSAKTKKERIYGPVYNPEILWVLKSTKGLTSAPVGNKGILYFGGLNNHVYAVNALKGNVIWYKKLKQRGKEAIGIHSSVLIYKNSVIVANGDGYLYALNKKNGKIIWGPKDLKFSVYSSPVIEDGKVFITTTGEGLLWIFNAKTGKAFRKLPIRIGSPIYSNVLVEKPEEEIFSSSDKDYSKNRTYKEYMIHVIIPSKVISLRLDLATRLPNMLEDISIQGSITSNPILYKNKLIFATRQYLYCVNVRLRKLDWVKRVEKLSTGSVRKSYPTPLLLTDNQMLFHGSKAYNLNQGSAIWHYWSYGEITTDPAVSSDMVYMGGIYELYNRQYGFVAGVDIQKEGQTFFLTLNKPIASPIVLINKILYFATEDNKLYAIK